MCKDKILKILQEHPNGLRLRAIGMYMNVYHIKLADVMYELREEGLVKSRNYSDPANCEYYTIWSIT